MPESSLPGGAVNDVVRVGDTVCRPASPTTGFVGELLRLLEAAHWPGAPRFLGLDEEGRESLSYLEGHVAWGPEQPPAVSSDRSLAQVARLVREFHDLTAGTPLAGTSEVVCHNDLAPRNTVYRPDPSDGALRPVAFIDWDLAAPGARLHDVAHVCWQFAGLGPQTDDPADAARRVRLITDAYGLADRGDLVTTVLWWQERCRTGIETAAAAGNPAMARLRDSGVPAELRAAQAWVTAHRDVLEQALR